jgi:hypothetical protein
MILIWNWDQQEKIKGGGGGGALTTIAHKS